MTDVPFAAAQVLPEPSPVCAGDTTALSGVMGLAEAAAADCQTHAAAASRALADSRGGAVRALSAKLAHLQTSAATVERSAAAGILALRQYAEDVAELHAQAHTLETDVALSLVRIRSSAAEIDEIAQRRGLPACTDWQTPPPLFMPLDGLGTGTLSGDADSFNWQIASGVWAGAVGAIESACSEWRGLVAQRERAESALVGALGRTTLIDAGPGAAAPRSAVITALTQLLSTQRPWEPAAVQRLLGGMLTPTEVAKLWEQLGSDGTDLEELIAQYSFELAGADGLPFAVRDKAARAALDYALKSEAGLAHAFARLGLSPDDMTLTELRRDLAAVKEALRDAEEIGEGVTVQLVMLGSHDGAVTAGMSMGDLDTAERVGVFVSGMNSSVKTLGETIEGFREIATGAGSVAMVTWIGYRSPGLLEEPFQSRADRGSWPLMSFLGGISVSRGNDTLTHFALVGHSYGTNVAAEALKFGNHGVHSFVSLGSAGLKYGTRAEDLEIQRIYATHAVGDSIAPVGRKLHFRPTSNGGPGYLPRVDPRALEGAIVFSAEESEVGRGVTMHNLRLPIDWGVAQWAADRMDGVASVDEVGYLDPESTVVHELIRIMKGDL